MKPDHVIVYDRVKSKTANRFKRFYLQFTAPAVIQGASAEVNTPNNQKVYLSNLLPVNAQLSCDTSENFNMVAYLDPATHELKIEDPSNPDNIRLEMDNPTGGSYVCELLCGN